MKSIFTLIICVFSLTLFCQNLTSNEILDKSIQYHDPNGTWNSFTGGFTVEMTTPNASKRTSVILIDIPKEYFNVTATRDSVVTTYAIDKGKCQMAYNVKVIDSIEAKGKNMSCDKATLYKNYYTYLYGLPMKLKDPGTLLNNKVEKRRFKNKDYLVLKVNYDAAVGSDVWYFYFNPKTYAMEVYQFFKTDENGNENSESGEYILLSEESNVNGIKIPRVRAWYYNKDDKYLGTDSLIEK